MAVTLDVAVRTNSSSGCGYSSAALASNLLRCQPTGINWRRIDTLAHFLASTTVRPCAELAAELKRIHLKNQFLEADKEAVERKIWESQLLGEQREILDRQHTKQEVAQSHLSVHNKGAQQRIHNVQRERDMHDAFMREYESHFVDASAQAVALEAAIVTDQANKLAVRTRLKETKALDLSGQTLPNIGKAFP